MAAKATTNQIAGQENFIKSILVVPAEQPVSTQEELQRRANNEMKWNDTEQITCHITVQGWFRDLTSLWSPGDVVFVYSPMCPLYQQMGIQSATYTQDSVNGTETTLELVLPGKLNERAIPIIQSPIGGDQSTPPWPQPTQPYQLPPGINPPGGGQFPPPLG
jgi:prophage tail gpP-like protein